MNSKKVIAIIVSVLVVVALVVGGLLLYRSSSTNKEVAAFETTVNSLKDLPLQYSTGSYDAAYVSLVDECNLCLTNRDTERFSSLTDRIKELKLNIISQNKLITDYKTQLSTFKNAVSLYVITGANKTEYNRLLSDLQTAIDKSDTDTCNEASKQLTTLLSKCKTLNEQDASNANSADEKYKEQLDQIQKQLKDNEKKSKDTPPSVVYVVPDNCDFIIPDSNSRYLTNSDLSHLTKSQLRIARNEIFARYGRTFDSKDLQSYFNSKSWYNGSISAKDFNDDWMSNIEKANVELIQKYESKR